MLRSAAVVTLRVREREGQACDQLRAEPNRQEAGDILRMPERPGVRLDRLQEPDVVNEIAEDDRGEPGGDAGERDPRVIHGETVIDLAALLQ